MAKRYKGCKPDIQVSSSLKMIEGSQAWSPNQQSGMRFAKQKHAYAARRAFKLLPCRRNGVMRVRAIGAMLLLFGSALTACSQQIRILIIEANHGKPVIDECLNISLGPWHGTDLLASTNKDGAIVLSLDKDRASVETVLGKACNGLASKQPVPFTGPLTTISVLPDWYVSCQYSKKLTKDPAWLNASPAQRIPSFAVHDILSQGVVATNSCSKLRPTPHPGELVLVVRKRTFWEGMKS